MAAPRVIRTVIISAEAIGDGRYTLITHDGKFNTALRSEANAQAASWVRRNRGLKVVFPGGLPAVLHIWTRGTVVKLSR